METTGWFGAGVGFVIGLILGSFAGMASYRWPRSENWWTPSHCPHCAKQLGPFNLIPVLSWLFQRGKSACCGQKISCRYPLIELATALPLAIFGWRYGVSPELALLAVLICALTLLSLVDLETGYIPDGSHIVIALSALGWLALHPPESWWMPVLSLGQAGMVGVGLAYGYSRLRGRDMMGWGDVKLMAASSLWLKPELIPAYLGISGALGVVFGLLWRRKGKGEEFPFGPALVITLLALIYWQAFAV